MKIKYLIRGLLKSIPGIEYLYRFNRATGGTDKARYCYAVWLRHLVLAHEHGYTELPRRITELGPGDSLGVGISALICGAEYYLALDAKRYADEKINLTIFEELIAFFKERAPIPSVKEFPNLKPDLTDYSFPFYILTNEHLEKVLTEEHFNEIRQAIRRMNMPVEHNEQKIIRYLAPWKEEDVEETGTMDMVFSQTVLQHMSELDRSYQLMHTWLKKGGIISHMIDLSSTSQADTWDGHWAYSDWEWKVVLGRSGYYLNREPYSSHIGFIKKNNFRIISEIRMASPSSFLNTGKKPAKKFKAISETDMTTSDLFIQAIK